jgi:thiol:disulfide interchange protein DsbC
MRPNLVNVTAAMAALFSVQLFAAELSEEYAFIQEVLPGVEVTSVAATPVAGLLEVSVGADVYYISQDGKYFMQGEMMDLDTRVNLTEQSRTRARGEYLAGFSDETAITFAAEDEQYKVLVFTDIDCPYCRKLHREMADYNERGITVQYLFFPRSGPGTDSWAKADAVWCSSSRQQAMTDAKSGTVVEAEEDCGETAVAAHYKLGKDLGIAGTPAIFTESGQLIVGYRSAEDLEKLLIEEEDET